MNFCFIIEISRKIATVLNKAIVFSDSVKSIFLALVLESGADYNHMSGGEGAVKRHKTLMMIFGRVGLLEVE